MDCPHIPPDLIAYADQRVATCSEFLDRMAATESALMGDTGRPEDAVAVCSLGAAIDTHITTKAAVADALALAIRRLAAR